MEKQRSIQIQRYALERGPTIQAALEYFKENVTYLYIIFLLYCLKSRAISEFLSGGCRYLFVRKIYTVDNL